MKQRPNKRTTRNPFYDHPLLRKGGVHQKSNKAIRRLVKQKLKSWDDDVMVFP